MCMCLSVYVHTYAGMCACVWQKSEKGLGFLGTRLQALAGSLVCYMDAEIWTLVLMTVQQAFLTAEASQIPYNFILKAFQSNYTEA